MATRSSRPSATNDHPGYQRHLSHHADQPDPSVLAWLNEQDVSAVWATSISVLEVQYGIGILPAGKHRRKLADGFARVLMDELDGRILGLDQAEASRIGALLRSKGRPPDHDLARRDDRGHRIAQQRCARDTQSQAL